MKIAYIITFYNELNYGAVLQAYALKQALSMNGYDARFCGVSLKSFQKIEKSIYCRIKNLVYKFMNHKKRANFDGFLKNEFNIDFDNIDYGDLLKKKLTCDLVVCGSDQIWNPLLTNGIQPYYYGIGIESKKKISYAASCGIVDVLTNHITEAKKYLSELDDISVREKTTSNFLNAHGVDNSNVVDPTLLLEKEDWNNLLKKSSIKENSIKQQYIFVYDLEGTEQFLNKVNQISNDTGYPVISLRKRAHYHNNECRFPNASPYDFLYLIKNAEIIISNSYHAMLFSYIFEKETVIIEHTKYPERMSDFMEYFGLTFENGYIYTSFNKGQSKLLDRQIDASKNFLINHFE